MTRQTSKSELTSKDLYDLLSLDAQARVAKREELVAHAKSLVDQFNVTIDQLAHLGVETSVDDLNVTTMGSVEKRLYNVTFKLVL